MPDYGLSGRRAVVGGGSSGIGLAIAEALAEQGCKLHLIARDKSKLVAAKSRIVRQFQIDVEIHAIDFANSSELDNLINDLPSVDILVNNGAAAPSGSIETISDTEWREAWDRKVFSYIGMTRATLRKMYQQKSGVIINIIGGGILNKYDYVCGTTGNAALVALTNAVGSRSTDYNVRVVGINPTSTRTETFDKLSKERAQARFGDEKRVEELFENLPFGRICEPHEVANLAVFLASPLASYLSGTCINIDGGIVHR